MYRYLTRFIGMFALLPLVLSACGESTIEGTYYSGAGANEYLELKKDSTFYLKAGVKDVSGKYQVKGKIITLNPGSKMAATGKIENDSITDGDGTKWKKK